MQLKDFCSCDPATIRTKLGELPELPVAASEVLTTIGADDNSVDSIARAISKDQALAARILRIANSSFYGLYRQIKTLQDAVVILGAKVLRNLVMAISLKSLHHKLDTLERNLWEESIGYACGARFIAQRYGRANPDEAFLAGLLCNIGELVRNNSNSAEYRALLEKEYDTGLERNEIALQMFGYTFAQSGAVILDEWNLAPEISICTLLACEPQAVAASERELKYLVESIFISRSMCRYLAIGNNIEPRDKPEILFSQCGLEFNSNEFNDMLIEFSDFFRTNKHEILSA